MECEFYINYVICESAVALAEKINADGVLYKLCDMWINLNSNGKPSGNSVLYKLCDMWIHIMI